MHSHGVQKQNATKKVKKSEILFSAKVKEK